MPEMTDSERLRVLADWFDKSPQWSPENNEVQQDLRRIADELEVRRCQDLPSGSVVHPHTGEDCPWCRLLNAARSVCVAAGYDTGWGVPEIEDLEAAIKVLDPEWEG